MRAGIEKRLAMLEQVKRHTIPDRSKLNPDRIARIADHLVSDAVISMDELKPMLRAAYDH